MRNDEEHWLDKRFAQTGTTFSVGPVSVSVITSKGPCGTQFKMMLTAEAGIGELVDNPEKFRAMIAAATDDWINNRLKELVKS